MKRKGKFITLEGIDGAGKSTHAATLATLLEARGIAVLRTREPGGTALGEALRTVLLSTPMQLETEALLMFAARQEHLAQVLLPALARGEWVVCDRFTDASFAYQGGGRGLSTARLEILADWVQQGVEPDLTLLIDVPVSVALARIEKDVRNKDRFEQEQEAFFQRVRATYLERAQNAPQRFRVINGEMSREMIQNELAALVASL